MVARVVREIRRSAPGFDVLVVDDGSTDATAAEAEAAGATVLTHPFNLGIGGAMQSGYKYALRSGYDVAVQVDGDGQHKPSYLNDMVAALQVDGQADMVYGSRFRGDPGYKVPLGTAAGEPGLLGRPDGDHPAEDHRPHLGLPDDQPARHRAVRPRLSARLPGGRGDPDAARPPPAHPRGAGAHERARLRPQLDRLPAQRLLHGQGAARPVRRPVPPAPDPDGPRARSPDGEPIAPGAAVAGSANPREGAGT